MTDRHLADLRSSGLTDATIAASGIYSATGPQVAKILGFDPGPGYVIPYLGTEDERGVPFRRVKPDTPMNGSNGKPAKYLAPKKEVNPAGNRLYVPPNFPAAALRDPTVRLFGTEGEKKTLAGNQEGFPTVGFSGVTCWVSRNGDSVSKPIADLDRIAWEGRELYLVFDSDAATKPEVRHEEKKLAAELTSRGARVRTVRLPKPTAREDREFKLGGKFGMDDFLRVRGCAAFEGVLTRAKEPKPQSEPGRRPSADLAEAFLDQNGWRPGGSLRLRWWREEFYRFNGIHYEPLPAGDLRAQINLWLQADSEQRGAAGSRRVSAILQNLEAMTFVDASIEPPAWLGEEVDRREYVVLSNGIIAVDDLLGARFDALQPHSPEYFSLSALPFPLDANTDCPRWMKFLDEMLPDPATQAVVKEMFGYLLVNDTTLERFFLLEGAGANGKTVVCTVLREILGPSNVCAVNLEAFSATRTFPLAATIGKKANIVEELDEITKAAEGTLKNFVTGKPMTIERKNKDAFEFTPTARLVFATNVLPRFIDRTDGLWRRMTLIPFEKQILDRSKQDKNLINAAWWRASGELPAIFLWAIGGLADVRARGDFEEPEACRVAKEGYRHDSNPAGTFVTETCVLREGVSTSSTVLYRRYHAWAEDFEYRPLAATQFAKEVRRAYPQVRLTAHPQRFPGGRSRAWIGLEYRGED
ncbi:MAG: phage/plasmid primase, P4 family [bacterium]